MKIVELINKLTFLGEVHGNLEVQLSQDSRGSILGTIEENSFKVGSRKLTIFPNYANGEVHR